MSEVQSDPFADAADDPVATEADPFADAPEESTLGDDGAPENTGLESGDPPAPASAIDPDIPLVNREGQPAEPAPAEAPAEAAATPEAPEAPEEPQTAPDGGEAPPQEPPAAPPATDEPPAPASEGEDGGAASGEDGKGVLRHYHVMYQTGASQWTDLELRENMEHVVQVDGELWVLARSADHARRIAWPLLGRPAQGVTVVAVAKNGWAPKRIKARTVPAREALEIS